ncbi:alpha/beta hydrolase [Epilithonimonas sp.]|uniref:alpha/beta hydrolase n=1 Tax=Epilithonimonas sp. TaxID=2894511 RepID=UPI00289ABBC7|nr:alpha/beta hydrolase [Epilithonimonas sp.]
MKRSTVNESTGFKLDILTYIDQSRNRKIPVAIYQPKNKKQLNNIPIIFSHGYGENKGGDYLYAYTYLTEFLVSKGYFVVSIQHELPTDELLAVTGNIKETRKPNWERGAQNIYFVLQEIKKNYPQLQYNELSLIGHSNGGDMTVLFAHKYPELANKIISMDNRRMELPRTAKPRIYSLRSNDYSADENVLPTDAEAKKYNIVIEFTDINHSNMDNDANEKDRKYLTEKILDYLKN